MNRFIILASFITSSFITAQVGINTKSPAVTLDIAASADTTKAEGLLTPRLTESQLRGKTYTTAQNSALVYITTVSSTNNSGPTEFVKTPGFYYYNADLNRWINLNMPKFFYMPSVAITPSMQPEVNLYSIYKNQFTNPAVKSTNASGNIPILGPNDLEYYVTSYDTSVFTIQSINESGVMQFSANTNTSDVSFMNIVFVVK